MEQIERIKQMEQHLDRASQAVMKLSAALDDYTEAQDAITALSDYYGSDEWKQDYADDEAGRLPTGLKRGVLSEDGIWNVMADNRELIERVQEFITRLGSAIGRTAMALLLAVMTFTTAGATTYIKDVMVIGGSEYEVTRLKLSYESQGWTFVDYNLNQGCDDSDIIYLLYKSEDCGGVNMGYITDFYISNDDEKPFPDDIDYKSRTYHLATFNGGNHFKENKGDLNSNAGGDYIHLYYTKDLFTDSRAVTGISFDSSVIGAVGVNGGSMGYDLNKGCGKGTDYIYMHFTTARARTEAETITLTQKTEDQMLIDGDIVKGTGGDNTRITIADGATVTLSGITINGVHDQDKQWAGITCLGDATLILTNETTNNVRGFEDDYPGIFVPENKTLTIKGNGSLNAVSNGFGAGIGGGWKMNCGNITIESGNITAYNDYDYTAAVYGCAGIGAGWTANVGTITIKGGNVYATGSLGASGIGSGQYGYIEAINITGGTVYGKGGKGSAGIGCGREGEIKSISIGVGITKVTAEYTGNIYEISDSEVKDLIGASLNGKCSSVTIAPSLYDKTVGNVRTIRSVDINGDGQVDVGDIMAIINFMANPLNPPGGGMSKADANDDGQVDVGDIMVIINVMATL